MNKLWLFSFGGKIVITSSSSFGLLVHGHGNSRKGFGLGLGLPTGDGTVLGRARGVRAGPQQGDGALPWLQQPHRADHAAVGIWVCAG